MCIRDNYDTELLAVLNRLVPQRTVTYRRRSSDPWFDDECRQAKRRTRCLERASSRAARAATTDPSAANAAAAAAAITAWTTERRVYRDLQNRKREEFWQTKIESERSTPQRLWRSIDSLMGRGHAPSTTSIDAQDLHRFFEEKIDSIRASTAGAAAPSFVSAPPGCDFSVFHAISVDDVIAAIHQLPDKQCATDPIPTRLLKDCADVMALFVTELFNRSLSAGVFPVQFKAAFITPLLKKSDLDPLQGKSYRPMSNLTVLSKTLERLVARQLVDYLSERKLFPVLQSAYRAYHSTETAVFCGLRISVYQFSD